MAAHSTLAPSFAPVWGHCSGAVAVNAAAPEQYSPETAEGTAAHWVASECLKLWQEPGAGAPPASYWIGEAGAPGGIVIDEEITEAVQVYVSDVLKVAQEHGALRQLLIEHKVHAPQIHADNWGTLDCALWLPDKGLLYLWDYKHGHRLNSAVGNLQLVDYIAGLIAELNINGHDDQHITAVLRIVQPRCYHSPTGPVSEWRVTLSDLRGYFNTLHNQAAEAYSKPTLTTGLHCRDCPGVGRCSAARMAGYSLVDYVRQPFAIDTMTAADLATERAILSRGLKAAQARLEAIEDDLTHRLKAGDSAGTGLSLQSSQGRRAWSVPPPVVLTMARQFGFDASKPDVITPTQFVKAAPAAMQTAVQQAVNAISHRPPGALKLVDAADCRTALAFKPQE